MESKNQDSNKVNISIFRKWTGGLENKTIIFLYSVHDPIIVEFIQQEINSRKVVIFSKTYCSLSKKAKSAFHDCDCIFYTVELDMRRNGFEIEDALKMITGNSHTPFVFFKGKYLGGGHEDFLEIHEMDSLRILLDVPPRPIYPLNRVYERAKDYLKKQYSVDDLSNPPTHLVTQTRKYHEPLEREDAAVFITPDMPDYVPNLLSYFFKEKDKYGDVFP